MNAGSADRTGPHGIFLTIIAMFCFAANSVLCRLALGPHLIDPASFTSVRVAFATAVLIAIVGLSKRPLSNIIRPNWRSIAALFTYLVFFSLAYARLSTGTGALILFGAVQLTMFTVALRQGEPFPTMSWVALAVAVSGLVYLLLPSVTAPDPIGAAYMCLSGIAWGSFSLLARGAGNPTEANASNFLFCLPLVGVVSVVSAGTMSITPSGFGFAAASGMLASGLGYVIWYAALRHLSGTNAATVQLSVPAIAAFGGVLFLSEPITARLIVASCALLGGVAVVIAQRPRRAS